MPCRSTGKPREGVVCWGSAIARRQKAALFRRRYGRASILAVSAAATDRLAAHSEQRSHMHLTAGQDGVGALFAHFHARVENSYTFLGQNRLEQGFRWNFCRQILRPTSRITCPALSNVSNSFIFNDLKYFISTGMNAAL